MTTDCVENECPCCINSARRMVGTEYQGFHPVGLLNVTTTTPDFDHGPWRWFVIGVRLNICDHGHGTITQKLIVFAGAGTPRITTLIVPFFRYLSFLRNSPKHDCISYNFQSHSDMAARLRHNPTCRICVVAVS